MGVVAEEEGGGSERINGCGVTCKGSSVAWEGTVLREKVLCSLGEIYEAWECFELRGREVCCVGKKCEAWEGFV